MIHLPVRLVGKPKETKKKDTQNSGKLAIRPDHRRRQNKIKLCVVRCALYISNVIQIG